ncbi:MAG: hypothetical protein RLZZ32_1426 [Cyanobacteriota bacterium]|jgi:hypothetical protein
MPTRRSDEGRVSADIALAFGHGDCRLWRNNTGALKDARGQLVRYGLCPGSPDRVGLRTIIVTPEMVGKKIAVFAAIEVKDRGRPTKQQQTFIKFVQDAGGLAGFAHNVGEARAILYPNWLPPV